MNRKEKLVIVFGKWKDRGWALSYVEAPLKALIELT